MFYIYPNISFNFLFLFYLIAFNAFDFNQSVFNSYVLDFSFKAEIMEIALNNDGPVTERQIAFIDKNRDLSLRTVRQIGAPKYNKLCEYFFVIFSLSILIV